MGNQGRCMPSASWQAVSTCLCHRRTSQRPLKKGISRLVCWSDLVLLPSVSADFSTLSSTAVISFGAFDLKRHLTYSSSSSTSEPFSGEGSLVILRHPRVIARELTLPTCQQTSF